MDLNLSKNTDTNISIQVYVSTSEVNNYLICITKKNNIDIKSLASSKNLLPEIKQIISITSNQIVDDAIEKAIIDYKIRPINKVLCDEKQVCYDTDFSFALHFEVLPHIQLSEKLDALVVNVEAPMFEEKEYYHFIQQLRRTQAKLEPIAETRKPQSGDVVFLIVESSYQGKPVLGMAKRKIALPLETQHQEHAELAEIARTLNIGEKTKSSMQLSSDYPDYMLQNKFIDLDVTLLEVHKEILPEVNDVFAQSLGFDTTQQLHDMICKEILNQKITSIQERAEKRLLQELVEPLDFSIPSSLLALHEEQFMMYIRNFYKQQGLSEDMTQENISKASLHYQPEIIFRAKSQAFLMALAYREHVNVTEADIEKKIKAIAEQIKQKYEFLHNEIYESGTIFGLQDQILADKAMHLLYTKTKKNIMTSESDDVESNKLQSTK